MGPPFTVAPETDEVVTLCAATVDELAGAGVKGELAPRTAQAAAAGAPPAPDDRIVVLLRRDEVADATPPAVMEAFLTLRLEDSDAGEPVELPAVVGPSFRLTSFSTGCSAMWRQLRWSPGGASHPTDYSVRDGVVPSVERVYQGRWPLRRTLGATGR